MCDLDEHFPKANIPRNARLEIIGRWGQGYYCRDILQAVSHICYHAGLKKNLDKFQGLFCGVNFEDRDSGYVYFQVRSSSHGNYSQVNMYVLQNEVGLTNYQPRKLLCDYHLDLKTFVECLKEFCSQNDIPNNLINMKICKSCERMMFIDKPDYVCRFCNPFLYVERKEEEVKRIGYVYFCTDDEYIKIGSSNKYPDKRILSLSTNYHKKFKLLGYVFCEDFRKEEKRIHSIFYKDRLAGEWFDLQLDNIRNVLKDNNLEFKEKSE